MGTSVSLAEARRIALRAPGFGSARPRRPAARDIERVIARLGVLQLDFVNVLAPAHYQVVFSRLGPYRDGLFDEAVYGSGRFTEQWAHEASVIPVETWPLLKPRMAEFRVRPYGFERFLAANGGYVARTLEEVRRRGPLTAAEVAAPAGPDGMPQRIEGAWFDSIPRATLEAHFARGLLAVVERRANFARVYDLAERVLPPEHYRREPTRDEARRELLRRAARACGIGTAADLADYFRMPLKEARPRLVELVAAGELETATVEGWREPAYLDRAALPPRPVEAAALISPFDPLIWFRPRVERLFGFEYRVEIYVPREKRRWGYYVLPFLMGERLAARVDLKADRAGGRLLVLAAHLEAWADAVETASALAAELRAMAAWRGLEEVHVQAAGPFARQVRAALD